MQLPNSNTEEETRDYNLPIYGQTGEYSLTASIKVPYFMSLLDLKRVTQELKTHEEVSPSLENNYNLVELFQRNIDPGRVRKEIVEGYLKNPNKLKFFNSLTIVLLPKDESGNIRPDFVDYAQNDPQIPYLENNDFDSYFAQEEAVREVFGGVQFVRTDAAALSRLRWDKRRVDAVAVDGQHRLKALKLWMEQNNHELGETAKATRIPIIFLLLHEKAGFQAAAGGSSAIKVIAREIFTDLNKNAREVDLATQIILDDRSLSSCCVRALITESTCQDDDELLPLSLLRWQDANNRFDQKYFLNSLVNLHLIIENLLGLDPPVKDPMNKNKALTYLESVITQVGLVKEGGGKDVMADDVGLIEFYNGKFIDEDSGDPKTPLTNIPVQFLKAAVEGFKTNYSEWILKLLKQFKPYQDLIDYARTNDLIDGVFAKYLAQPKEHREQLEADLVSSHGENWERDLITSHIIEIEKFKGLRDVDNGGEQWAFKTIFQKAYLRLGKALFFEATDEESERLGTVADFISFMNGLYESNVLRVGAPLDGHNYNLWTFTAVNYGNGKIRVASTSEARIQAVLTLSYYIYRHSVIAEKPLSIEEGEGYISLYATLNMLALKKSTVEWPNCHDMYYKLHKEYIKSADVIKGVADASELSDKDKKTAAVDRLKGVFAVILDCYTSKDEAVAEEDNGDDESAANPEDQI